MSVKFNENVYDNEGQHRFVKASSPREGQGRPTRMTSSSYSQRVNSSLT
eukprot:CAMPEP_0115031310 /NCGR_PEP_ID=MMETSP0216-20121206/38453_1 /TAXON_ID=223996 /ORGANISM="Protocruzia adherens, Strain Boccale" /LENGTH=48 /DNA_ID= /DNA_START= /DNA_END= /DNA_ORIENTATION=